MHDRCPAGEKERLRPQGIRVSQAEHGMKLLRLLERHTGCPRSMLHKWIRTGQVRINGKRSKPFTLVSLDDDVRLPPFVLDAGKGSGEQPGDATGFEQAISELGADMPVLFCKNDILALNKPSGLAVQPGSGLADSVAARLQSAFSRHAYIPAPAHRLDRHTSGVLLCGLSHASQKKLHEWFADGQAAHKEYLVWVSGEWGEGTGEVTLEDCLQKGVDDKGKEVMRVVPRDGQYAASMANLLNIAAIASDGLPAKASLLQMRLLTGRTHQIRVQLASRGYPVIGDPKYGGPKFHPLLLHAWRVTLPDGTSLCAQPPWTGVFAPVTLSSPSTR